MYKEYPIRCNDGESVRLINMFLTEVPEGFVKSKAIKSISLEKNLIDEVPENIFNDIPNLECLNLARNKIPYKSILNFRHDSLKSLIVSHQKEEARYYDLDEQVETVNRINLELDTTVSYFPQLENLYLDGIYFEYFHDFFNQSFPNLKSLSLAENGLHFIKPDILSILPYTMRSLHLEKNNFDRLRLDHTANLEALYLDGNPLTALEINFPTSNLKLLSLANCSWSSLGPDVFYPNFSSLMALDMSYNLITEISTSLFQTTPYLENLSLSHNRLTKFPVLYYLQKLSTLSLSYNFIEDIMDVIPLSSLKILNLRGNRISVIDKMAFSQLEFLQELDLSKNNIQSLPIDWCTNLKNLQYLNLKSNQFARIADMSITWLLHLKKLYISGNQVTEISKKSLQLLPNQCTVYVI